MRKYTQKELRGFISLNLATDITQLEPCSPEAKELYKRLNQIGYSSGIYGINGALFEDVKTGERFAIVGRCSTLLYFC